MFKTFTSVVFLILALAVASPDRCLAQTYTYSGGAVNSPEGVLRASTSYTMYVPPSLTNRSLRGTIIWIHNIPNGDSGKPSNPTWMAFASEMRMALMEASGDNPANFNWQHDHWTNYAASVTNAVAQLGIISGHPELAQLGITLSGGSASANASVNMTANIPERIICTSVTLAEFGFGWWASSSDSSPRGSPAEWTVPMFVDTGLGETTWIVSRVIRSYVTGRARDAPWVLCMNETKGHSRIGEDVLIAFLRAFINLRLGANHQPGQAMNKIDITKGWLGYPKKPYTVAPYATYTGNKKSAMWLPDGTTAAIWAANH